MRCYSDGGEMVAREASWRMTGQHLLPIAHDSCPGVSRRCDVAFAVRPGWASNARGGGTSLSSVVDSSTTALSALSELVVQTSHLRLPIGWCWLLRLPLWYLEARFLKQGQSALPGRRLVPYTVDRGCSRCRGTIRFQLFPDHAGVLRLCRNGLR